MDAKRAAEVLRAAKAGHLDLRQAEEMGAQALEAWAWVERGQQTIRLSSERGKWEGAAHGLVIGYGPTPLAAVLDAMEKEGKG
jgi:hypothetical protein